MTIKGYITNLGKYNEGELVGKWIEFPIEEDDLNEVLKEIGCKYYDEETDEYFNEEYEEIFFTDWECDADFNFGEYENIDNINEIAEIVNGFTSWEEKTFEAACELWNVSEILENGIDNYNLYEDIETDYDLGYYWVNECGCYDLDKMGNLANYIDYEAFGRDVRFESSGGFTSLGWVECC
jgi:antirestriction protein